MNIEVLYDRVHMPQAIQQIIRGRDFERVVYARPWNDDDYTFVLVEFTKAREYPKYHVFSGACLRPTVYEYRGNREDKAFRVFLELLIDRV